MSIELRPVIEGFAAIARAAAVTTDDLQRVFSPAVARAAAQLYRELVALPAYERVWLRHASWRDRFRYKALRLGGSSPLHAILIVEADR